MSARNRDAKRRRDRGEQVPRDRTKIKRFRGVNVLGQEVTFRPSKSPQIARPAAQRSEADITREINGAWRAYLIEANIPAKMVSLRKMLRRAFAAGFREGLR